jgi:DNA-binding transcriptional ArsR family regulator
MAAKARGREGKGGISPRALAASESGEAPGPGAERAAWSSDLEVAGSRSLTGAASLLKGRALEVVRCPLCGKLVRRHSAPAHTFAHLEKLERAGIVQLVREDGQWVVIHKGTKHVGASWTTLLRIAEKLEREGVMAGG